MAQLIGGLATSHIPAIGGAIHQGKQQDPYWKPFFDGFPPISNWLAQVRPDTVVVFYNDHGLNFFLDKMPTFAVGAAPEYRNADEGWGLPTTAPLPGNLDLSWHLINHLIDKEFDIVTCQEMLIDHACTLPFKLFWPGHEVAPVKIVPININTVQFPLPTARRVYKLGQAVGEAIRSGTAPSAWWCWAPAACRTSSKASAPASSTSALTCSSSTAWNPTPNGPRSSATWNWWKKPARRAWNCSTGWPCAARSRPAVRA